MSTLEAVWLGIVQGLTEFFPVSSSGHLALFQTLLGIETEGLVFEVSVHVATVVAILLFYHAKIRELVVGVLAGRADALRYTGKLAVATLPAVLVGLTARHAIAEYGEAVRLDPRLRDKLSRPVLALPQGHLRSDGLDLVGSLHRRP